MDHDDDRPVGHILSRREALSLFGAAGVLLLPACSSKKPQATSTTTTTVGGQSSTTQAAGATTTPAPAAQVAAPSCVARPAIEEGPFFVDEKLNRSDVRVDLTDGATTPGVPLKITFRVARLSGSACTALPGATVDIWSATAAGKYSDEASQGTAGNKVLRGFQATDANGLATFTTVYPGWYSGRAVHVHVKIRPTQGQALTTQLFFDDTVSDNVFAQPPYSSRPTRDTRNANDRIFGQGGSQTLLALTRDGQGYAAAFDVGLQM
jgi:protocatechuate 3,4-dioxygenase beta subunit